MRKSRVSKTEVQTVSGRRWGRDPLLHFAVAGALLFGLYLLRGEGVDDGATLLVSAEQQSQLAAVFTRTWRRPPSEADMQGLVDDWLREEVANREAVALGLAGDDLIVRRRLRQKYEAYLDQVSAPAAPDDVVLADYFHANAARYRQPARYSFTQLFFSADRRDDPAADAGRALRRLGDSGPDAGAEFGDGIALPGRLVERRAAEVAGRFGESFSEALAALPTGRWSGPVPSAYGQHLVYVERVTAAALPALASLRERVLGDWQEEQRRAARTERYRELLDAYTVILEERPGPAAPD